jgi:hypothetical protein
VSQTQGDASLAAGVEVDDEFPFATAGEATFVQRAVVAKQVGDAFRYFFRWRAMMNIMTLEKISASPRMSCLISAQCSIIVQPPSHDRIVSTTVSIPSIPTPTAAPLAIL